MVNFILIMLIYFKIQPQLLHTIFDFAEYDTILHDSRQRFPSHFLEERAQTL